MPFDPIECHIDTTLPAESGLPGPRWHPVLKHDCAFGVDAFFSVTTNLIQNPNITSSHLFRADILYDSQDGELQDADIAAIGPDEVKERSSGYQDLSGFTLQRTLIRRFVPRNPTLDKPIDQTCLYFRSTSEEKSLVIMRPNVDRPEQIPWYHPAVQAIAYQHTWDSAIKSADSFGHGTIWVHYQLFPEQALPLDTRLVRTARNLLRTLHKHGEGKRHGYVKKGRHDQLLSQKRVQDTYSTLKQTHAKRLCDAWVEQTEPSKHVFEDLSIAAYLIELWRDMYAVPGASSSKPPFPGFVDIGCGNGVLTEILLLEGYTGKGYDARRRKTWAVLSATAQANLHEMLFVPQPLFDLQPAARGSLAARAKELLGMAQSGLRPPRKPWHNALFADGTFIISNHADELTAWTPLLAALTLSPFLAIPCCSHNLSGARFRAPSAFNSNSADAAAPSFFEAHKQPTRAKSIAISIPGYGVDQDQGPGSESSDDEPAKVRAPDHAAERGSLRKLAPAARKKQPSAYASLCEWAAHLGREVGFDVETDMLRIPSTRNVGIVGRRLLVGGDVKTLAGLDARKLPSERQQMQEHVMDIVRREKADGSAWVARCEGVLVKAEDGVHV